MPVTRAVQRSEAEVSDGCNRCGAQRICVACRRGAQRSCVACKRGAQRSCVACTRGAPGGDTDNCASACRVFVAARQAVRLFEQPIAAEQSSAPQATGVVSIDKTHRHLLC